MKILKPIKRYSVGDYCHHVVVGVIKAKDWWSKEQLKRSFPAVLLTDYVVSTWHEYSPIRSSRDQEAKITIAIFRKRDHAISFWKSLPVFTFRGGNTQVQQQCWIGGNKGSSLKIGEYQK
jgi:hypothetical protein